MIIAIDIGGTKIDVGYFAGNEVQSRILDKQFPTPELYDNLLDEFKRIVAIHPTKNCSKLTVSVAGIVVNNQLAQVSNIPDYSFKPLATDLEKIFSCSAELIQDSQASIIAEYKQASVSNKKRIVSLTFGTGLGGAMIEQMSGHIFVRPLEIWGMIVDVASPHKHKMVAVPGILEATVGGGNLEARIGQSLALLADSHSIWNEVVQYTRVAIHNVSALLQPELIVLGGGMVSKRTELFKQALKPLDLKQEIVKTPQVQLSTVEGNGSLLGALSYPTLSNHLTLL